MAKKKQGSDEAGGRQLDKKKIIGGVVAAGLVYQFVIAPKLQPEETAEEAAARMAEIEEGDVVPVPELVLNLADPDDLHYVRVGVAVILAEGASAEKFEPRSPIVSDIVVDTISDMTLEELRAPGAKEAVKEELTERVREEFNEDRPTVARVIFTSFVMQ